ncbi:threonine/homoserine/homoserine lactone efflux protein [Paenibacillus forsythiae]|uniref:Threonine/homoserine/homoserine lactone efflux protein n=1 Tax=Paenibacillus forsythiae TaxID=365616 RepID=A0ABU3H1S0_9BACL|nr:LysE family translocator [Paenibacillus forsythiae]MDT3424763.1 threonine/homoserine/homoserine lactone efflux protein [Paenibacillus forsythiae]
MFTISMLAMYIGAAVLLILIPGPDLIFAVTQGVTNGRKAGVYTAAGLAMGNIIHTLAAALGLSIIIKTSPLLFILFKVIGAIYLFNLARKSLKFRKAAILLESGEKKNERALLVRGLAMNVLNPKVAIFFLTFLPQFVNYDYGYASLQMIILGLIFIVLTAVIFGLLAYFAGVFSRRLLEKPKVQEYANIAAGGIFALLGIKLLTTSP